MHNEPKKIANIKANVTDDCPKDYVDAIKMYWQINNEKFTYLVRTVSDKFNLSQPELIKIIKQFSNVSLYRFCNGCGSYERHQAKNRSVFNYITKNLEQQKVRCEYCTKQKLEVGLEYKRNKNVEFDPLNNAIKNENWNNLSDFERQVLYNCLKMNFHQIKYHYGNILGRKHFIKLIIALENIANQNLIILNRNFANNYIFDYHYLDKLLEYRDHIYSEAKSQTTNKNSFNQGSDTNTIKMTLTFNTNQKHPYSPRYSGLINFEERIVINPNIEYIFGHWQRDNNNMYLTLTPLEEINKQPNQRSIESLPISLQEGIADFLSKLGQNIDY